MAPQKGITDLRWTIRLLNHDRRPPSAKGDQGVVHQPFDGAHEELRALASVVRIGKADPTLNTTLLAYEAHFKLSPGGLEAESEFRFRTVTP